MRYYKPQELLFEGKEQSLQIGATRRRRPLGNRPLDGHGRGRLRGINNFLIYTTLQESSPPLLRIRERPANKVRALLPHLLKPFERKEPAKGIGKVRDYVDERLNRSPNDVPPAKSNSPINTEIQKNLPFPAIIPLSFLLTRPKVSLKNNPSTNKNKTELRKSPHPSHRQLLLVTRVMFKVLMAPLTNLVVKKTLTALKHSSLRRSPEKRPLDMTKMSRQQEKQS